MPPSTAETMSDIEDELPKIKTTSSASPDAADLPVPRKRPFEDAFAHEESPELGSGYPTEAPERDGMSAAMGDIGMRVASLITGSFGNSTDGNTPSGQVVELQRQLEYQKGVAEHLVQQVKRSAKRLADEEEKHKETSFANESLHASLDELQVQLMEADDDLELRIAEHTREIRDAKIASNRTEKRLCKTIEEKDEELVSLRSELRMVKGQAGDLKRAVEVIQDVAKDVMRDVKD
ncbi:hypothetical protein PG985_010536 [Apiospora marii]|uniref:TATA element modulatory factor 1 TATA binding domain-containing protein n=1 Tax=Apiospora marii TaxID=335849 RepID=A0ABR1T189_9PEZI